MDQGGVEAAVNQPPDSRSPDTSRPPLLTSGLSMQLLTIVDLPS